MTKAARFTYEQSLQAFRQALDSFPKHQQAFDDIEPGDPGRPAFNDLHRATSEFLALVGGPPSAVPGRSELGVIRALLDAIDRAPRESLVVGLTAEAAIDGEPNTAVHWNRCIARLVAYLSTVEHGLRLNGGSVHMQVVEALHRASEDLAASETPLPAVLDRMARASKARGGGSGRLPDTVKHSWIGFNADYWEAAKRAHLRAAGASSSEVEAAWATAGDRSPFWIHLDTFQNTYAREIAAAGAPHVGLDAVRGALKLRAKLRQLPTR